MYRTYLNDDNSLKLSPVNHLLTNKNIVQSASQFSYTTIDVQHIHFSFFGLFHHGPRELSFLTVPIYLHSVGLESPCFLFYVQ